MSLVDHDSDVAHLDLFKFCEGRIKNFGVTLLVQYFLLSMVCKINTKMCAFENELSGRHVTCHGQRLLLSSWSPAMPADMLERALLHFLAATCLR